MNARRVNRSVKSINRKKRSRNPPAASIGNNCNPTTAFKLDERFFRNSILPVALANHWIETDTQIGLFRLDIPIDGPVRTLAFSEPNIFALHILVEQLENEAIANPVTLTILYSNGSQYTFNQSDIDKEYDLYYVTITPINITVYEDTQSHIVNTVNFELKESAIIGINVTNAQFIKTRSFNPAAYIIGTNTSVNTRARSLYDFRNK